MGILSKTLQKQWGYIHNQFRINGEPGQTYFRINVESDQKTLRKKAIGNPSQILSESTENPVKHFKANRNPSQTFPEPMEHHSKTLSKSTENFTNHNTFNVKPMQCPSKLNGVPIKDISKSMGDLTLQRQLGIRPESFLQIQ